MKDLKKLFLCKNVEAIAQCLKLSQSKSKSESKIQFDFIDNFSMPSDLKNWLDAADWIYVNCYCICMTVATIHLQS